MPNVRQFRGAAGAAQMSPEATCTAHTPATFAATLMTVKTASVEIAQVDATAYGAKRSLAQVAAVPVDFVRLIIVLRGALRVRQDGRTNIVDAGAATLVRTDAPYQFALSNESSMVVVSVARPLTTPHARRHLRSVTAEVISDSMLVETILAFVRPRLDRLSLVDRAAPTAFESVVISSLSAIISSAIVGGDPSGNDPHHEPASMPTSSAAPIFDAGTTTASAAASAQLVSSATTLLIDRIRSPDLTAASLAADLGVSVRNLYRAFEAANISVGDLIRSTRLDMIAARLRVHSDNRTLDQLARAYGFRSADVCARAFKSRFGMTMTAYELARPRVRSSFAAL
ncbi:helix-turn-helix domain-containing protein [Subtercola vilae]|uniref:Helix-turn-helix domain-containing protein n=1 Tax=Subtercola vilae TaxID=2056433 RepID=A0A4T2CFC2_9MICO|nr:helix-turn-helix domain-containing protein [Subtercola vilae]TIH40888.1 helix-turn-helix domain-containing protein [Subtercola vilae]